MHDYKDERIYFSNLDSLRFIAALMVFLQHGISPSFKYLPVNGTFLQKFLVTICNGGIGVSIFFVLSGFLITFLLKTEHTLHGKVSLKRFYMRRVLRIWPLFFLVVLFTFVLYPFLKSLMGMDTTLSSDIRMHLTFLSNFDVINIIQHHAGNDAMSQNITWSVSIEEQFYLFWPLIFVFLPEKWWLAVISAVITGSLVFRIVNYNEPVILYFHTFSVLLDLAAGGLIALAIKKNVKIRTFFENTSTLHHGALFIVTFCVLLWYDLIFYSEYGTAVGRLLVSFLFGLIIASQAMTRKKSVLNLKNWRFASKWGKYTYGIYLLHPISITLLDVIMRLLKIPQDNFINLFILGIMAFLLTLILSKLSFIYYEAPFLKLKHQFTWKKELDR